MHYILTFRSMYYLTAVKPAVQLLQTLEVHSRPQCIPIHNYFAVNSLWYSTGSLWPYFTSKSPNNNQEVEQLFYCLFACVVQHGDIHDIHCDPFCACYPQACTSSTSHKEWLIFVPQEEARTLCRVFVAV